MKKIIVISILGLIVLSTAVFANTLARTADVNCCEAEVACCSPKSVCCLKM